MTEADVKDKLATHLRIKAAECHVPSHTTEGLVLYIVDGIEPGSFLRAVLENNLMEAMGRADITNRYYMHEICSFLYSYAPSNCKGSPERVEKWLARFH